MSRGRRLLERRLLEKRLFEKRDGADEVQGTVPPAWSESASPVTDPSAVSIGIGK